jgi:hypothetical protein
MRPDLVTEADAKDDRDKTLIDSCEKSRDQDMSVLKTSRDEGPGKSHKGKKWNNEGPVVPPKYEEPAQPVFSQVSRFAALGMDDEDEEEHASNDEKSEDEGGETVDIAT